jgi:hypothetical protein
VKLEFCRVEHPPNVEPSLPRLPEQLPEVTRELSHPKNGTIS